MTGISRRSLVTGSVALAALAACNNGLGSRGGQSIDARVDRTLTFLYDTYPGTRTLGQNAVGILVMPLVTEAGFLTVGGSYGRGALRVGGVSVDYYSAAQATLGPQLGAQQFAHALFFMTEDAFRDFRTSPGWAAGAEVEYAVNDRGGNIAAETTTSLSPVIAVVFGQAGLLAGATIEGTKYSRIIP